MKNYFKNLLLSGFFIAHSMGSFAQVSFTNSNNKLPGNAANYRSGCAVSVVDLNDDGLDDIVRLDQSKDLNIDIQGTDGNLQITF